jgi:hypothetical protein
MAESLQQYTYYGEFDDVLGNRYDNKPRTKREKYESKTGEKYEPSTVVDASMNNDWAWPAAYQILNEAGKK